MFFFLFCVIDIKITVSTLKRTITILITHLSNMIVLSLKGIHRCRCFKNHNFEILTIIIHFHLSLADLILFSFWHKNKTEEKMVVNNVMRTMCKFTLFCDGSQRTVLCLSLIIIYRFNFWLLLLRISTRILIYAQKNRLFFNPFVFSIIIVQ